MFTVFVTFLSTFFFLKEFTTTNMEPQLDILFDELCVSSRTEISWSEFESSPSIEVAPLDRIICETLDLSMRRLATLGGEVNESCIQRNLAVVAHLLKRKGLPGASCAVLLQYIVVVGKTCSSHLLSRHCEHIVLALLEQIAVEGDSAPATVAAAALRNLLRHVDSHFLSSKTSDFPDLWDYLAKYFSSASALHTLNNVVLAVIEKALRDANTPPLEKSSVTRLQSIAMLLSARLDSSTLSSVELAPLRGLHRRITAALTNSSPVKDDATVCDVASLRAFLIAAGEDKRFVLEDLRTALEAEEIRRHELEIVLRASSQDAAKCERQLADSSPEGFFQSVKSAVRKLGDSVSRRH